MTRVCVVVCETGEGGYVIKGTFPDHASAERFATTSCNCCSPWGKVREFVCPPDGLEASGESIWRVLLKRDEALVSIERQGSGCLWPHLRFTIYGGAEMVVTAPTKEEAIEGAKALLMAGLVIAASRATPTWYLSHDEIACAVANHPGLFP